MARKFSKKFYNSEEWKRTRELVLRRDFFLCVKCGEPAEEVHHKKHLTPENINDENITLNMENLVSLCKDCHFKEHYRDKARGHRKYNANDRDEEYVFDENGYLIKSPLVR